MALKIRLARGGAKRRPFYRIVVAENTSPRDGRFVERIGSYNPLLPQGHADRITVNKDRANHWLGIGAQPTERVQQFFAQHGLMEAAPRSNRPQKSQPKKKAQERLQALEEAKQEAKEAAAEKAAEARDAESAEASDAS